MEVIFLLRQLVLKHELGSDATFCTCDFIHKRKMGELCVSEKFGFEFFFGIKIKENILENILRLSSEK